MTGCILTYKRQISNIVYIRREIMSDTINKQSTRKTKLDLGKYELTSKKKLKTRQHLTPVYETSDSHLDEIMANLREMRKNSDAPVDSMGCHRCCDNNASPPTIRYQKLLALMLSSQTKDQITFNAMQKLIAHGCTIGNILETSDEKLGELIYPVGFWKSKIKYIKNTSKILKEKYNNDIPDNVKDLCKLPGVGPKMAHICMETAWDKVTGIGVDIHVHRISNRLGLIKSKTPEESRVKLEKLLPEILWKEFNVLLVGFGQQICHAKRPKCSECLNRQLCPFAINA